MKGSKTTGAGKRTGKDPSKVVVPPIFPDNEIVRSDILDYLVEIEHFDTMVSRAIESKVATGLEELKSKFDNLTGQDVEGLEKRIKSLS